jgi:hypothetical protein
MKVLPGAVIYLQMGGKPVGCGISQVRHQIRHHHSAAYGMQLVADTHRFTLKMHALSLLALFLLPSVLSAPTRQSGLSKRGNAFGRPKSTASAEAEALNTARMQYILDHAEHLRRLEDLSRSIESGYKVGDDEIHDVMALLHEDMKMYSCMFF